CWAADTEMTWTLETPVRPKLDQGTVVDPAGSQCGHQRFHAPRAAGTVDLSNRLVEAMLVHQSGQLGDCERTGRIDTSIGAGRERRKLDARSCDLLLSVFHASTIRRFAVLVADDPPGVVFGKSFAQPQRCGPRCAKISAKPEVSELMGGRPEGIDVTRP